MKHYLALLTILTTSAQAAGPFAHPRWCELTAKRDVGPYINAASGFVSIDPLLLATGMSSEGFAIKQDCSTKKKDAEKNPEDELYKKIAERDCNPERFSALNIMNVDSALNKADPTEWKVAVEYGPKNPAYASVDPVTKQVDLMTSRKTVELSYYGASWSDDGSDTFGLEYQQMRAKNYIPKKFSASDETGLSAKTFTQMPDFVFMTDPNDVNESATYRFKTNEGSYLNRTERQNPTQGDKGRTHYKTPEAQTFANAALWKHSQDKFVGARKELAAFYKAKGPSSPLFAKAAALERELSPTEMAFWSKAFYNGGQGTQAAAWDMLKQFAERGWMADDKYLYADPGVSVKPVYNNAREVSDSYAEVIKSPVCGDLLKSQAESKGVKLEAYSELESTGTSTGNSIGTKAAGQ